MNYLIKISGIIFILIIALACEDSINLENLQNIKANLDSYSDCKIFEKSTLEIMNEECVEYSYSNNTLILKHINSAFNCCPGELKFTYSLLNNVLLITEQETEANCNCLCLYDLDYTIEELPAGRYVIRFSRTYLPLSEDLLEAEINLNTNSSGKICVQRDSYPWIN